MGDRSRPFPRVGSSRNICTSEGSPEISPDRVPVIHPSGDQYEHHLVTSQRGAPGAVFIGEYNGRLLLGLRWCPTTLTGEWEFPHGFGDPGEGPPRTALRELHEATGIRAELAESLGTIYADSGLLANPIAVIHLLATSADLEVPEDEFESTTWQTPAELRAEIRLGRIRDGIRLAALALWSSRCVEQQC